MKRSILRCVTGVSVFLLAWVLTLAFASCGACGLYLPADLWLAWARFWGVSGYEAVYDLGFLTVFLTILILLSALYLLVRLYLRR
jgi:hypothetical protein